MIDQNRVPKFVFQNDEVKRANLNEVIQQEQISGSIRHQLDTELKRTDDVCDLLTQLNTTRDFLLVTGGEVNESLYEKMRKLRQKPNQKVLKQLQLKHVDDLIENLQLLRSRRMILHKQDPFNLVAADFKTEMDQKLLDRVLNKIARRLHPDSFGLRLHRFIMHRLTRGPEERDPPDGKLRDYLYAFMDAQDDKNADEYLEALDFENLLNCHAIALFEQLIFKS